MFSSRLILPLIASLISGREVNIIHLSTQCPTCAECGFNYVVGSPDDEASHDRLHAEYQYGPEIAALEQIPPFQTLGVLTLHLVDQAIPQAVRRNFYNVALVACREIGGPAGFDGTVNEEEQRLFVAAEGRRAVGMVLTAADDRFWPLAWKSDGSMELRGKMPSTHRGQKIARAWIAAEYRRRGLVFSMVRATIRLFACNSIDLGWELPFTESGARLVRRISPDVFWGCRDPFTLNEALHPRPPGKDT